MSAGNKTRRAWLEGFATGVAVCGLAVYAKRRLEKRQLRMIHEEGTVIPIE